MEKHDTHKMVFMCVMQTIMLVPTTPQSQQIAAHLAEKGWAIVPGIASKETCDQLLSMVWDWFEGFGTGIDRNSPSTWGNDRWPPNIHGIFQHYRAGHTNFAWGARGLPEVIQLFASLWGTKELLVSFDGFNLSKPSSLTGRSSRPWPHVDQVRPQCGLKLSLN